LFVIRPSSFAIRGYFPCSLLAVVFQFVILSAAKDLCILLGLHRRRIGRNRISVANDQRRTTNDYNNPLMLDEQNFRKHADAALESLKKSLIAAEDSADMEVEDQAGALHISFDDGSRFVISPNAPVRQIWISALSTSFKLDWSDAAQDFVLPKSGESLKALLSRLINQQLGEEAVALT
jgi:iron-sulfur cluster assembly protein CyaY